MIAAKDGAYAERNKLVAALSKLFPASLERHDGVEWEDDWRWVVFIDLPTGQASWHIHDSELPQFAHLPRQAGRRWDGHTNEQKYARLAVLSSPEPDAGVAYAKADLIRQVRALVEVEGADKWRGFAAALATIDSKPAPAPVDGVYKPVNSRTPTGTTQDVNAADERRAVEAVVSAARQYKRHTCQLTRFTICLPCQVARLDAVRSAKIL